MNTIALALAYLSGAAHGMRVQSLGEQMQSDSFQVLQNSRIAVDIVTHVLSLQAGQPKRPFGLNFGLCKPQQGLCKPRQGLAHLLLAFNNLVNKPAMPTIQMCLKAPHVPTSRRGKQKISHLDHGTAQYETRRHAQSLSLVMGLTDDVGVQPEPSGADSLVERVRSWLDSVDAFMLPPDGCARDIVFTGDLPRSTLKGIGLYSTMAQTWGYASRMALGSTYNTSLLRVAQLAPNEISVRWRADWSLSTLKWLEIIAERFGWEIERFDLDPSLEMPFNWSAASELSTALRTGRLKVPMASVEGRSVFRFDETGLCVAHRENIDILGLAARSQLRNILVAADVREFLNARRPPDIDATAWSRDVAAGVRVDDPEPLDVNRWGITKGQRDALGVGRLIFYGFVLFLLNRFLSEEVGVFGGQANFDSSICDEVAKSDYWYKQCVSDIYGGN